MQALRFSRARELGKEPGANDNDVEVGRGRRLGGYRLWRAIRQEMYVLERCAFGICHRHTGDNILCIVETLYVQTTGNDRDL